MLRSFRVIFLPCIALLCIDAGCSTQRQRPAPASTAPAISDSCPRGDAFRALEDIEPRIELAELVPTTRPAAARPPIEALNLYAQAVDALKDGRRFTAINLLEKALQLDPHSFELNYALGRAYVVGRTHEQQSISALERAAAINPDELELQTDLGRQYLARDERAKALEHLRLAVQTTEYKADDPGAPVAELFLARALQQAGYDRAALEQYGRLLRRVQGRSRSLRSNPHLAFLITDRLYVDIGDLYARNGQFEDALAAFEPAARRNPGDFDLEARVVRALIGLRRFDAASTRVADAVVRFRASKPSLDLLQEAHRATGATGGAADRLALLHATRPRDMVIFFALIESLRQEHRWAEAEGFLTTQFDRSRGDFAVVRRWVQLRLERDDVLGAAQLLVHVLADRPDFAGEIEGLWAEVISPARTNHLLLEQIQSLNVPRSRAAAKAICVAAVAGELRRQAIMEQSLERAVRVTPPFPPAFRERLVQIWQSRRLDDTERTRLTDELISLAGKESILAQELRGLTLLYRQQDKAAAALLGELIDKGASSASLLLSYAQALRGAGETEKSEQMMWKLLSDHPSFEDAYSTLYSHYAEAGLDGQAERVLSTWITAMPYSGSARLLQAARQFRAGRADSAREMIAKLLDERGDDASILRPAYAMYSRAGKSEEFIGWLEKRVGEQPGNVAALGMLVEIPAEMGRSSEIDSLIDAARRALADDPDHLYQVAHLYTRIGQAKTGEDVLTRVLEIDPAHSPAGNDLGYSWAERGENLARAEALIRHAVAAEPDNNSFLDSLGWVLYKRGKFTEAQSNLQKAAGNGSQSDPIVLDHLGDLLYRLGDRDAASKQWEQAGAKLTESALERDDLKKLKVDLERKAKQLKTGEPVTVSPVIEEPQQAKN